MIVFEKQGAVLVAYDPDHVSPAPKHHVKRGDVTTFSRKSRRRLLLLANRLDFSTRATFLTLTFHGSPTVSESNVAFKRFYKRLRRKFPTISGIWRREHQPSRGSIHFHLILFNLPYWQQRDIQATWEACTREDRSIVHVKLISGHKFIVSYVAKYIAKMPEDVGFTYLDVSPYQSAEHRESVGRCWGVINTDFLPFAPVERIAIDDPDVSASFWLLAGLTTNLRCGNDPHIAIVLRDDAELWLTLIKRKSRYYLDLLPSEGKLCYTLSK